MDGRVGAWLVIAHLVLAAAASAQVPTREQQKCLASMGKGALKVAKVQAREDRTCLQALARGRLVGSAEACLVADARGRVAKAADKNVALELARCADAAAPAFGSGGAPAANAAAQLAEVDLAHDLFGEPIDAGLASCDPDKTMCTCQAKTLAGAEKLFAALGKIHAGCLKKRFKDGSIASAADLETCLDDPQEPLSVAADARGKLAKGRAKLAAGIAKACDAPGVSTTAFPGPCDALSGAALADCLADRVECRFCQMTNAAEDTFASCDVLDDALANGSCEALSCPNGENACPGGCTDLDSDEANCGMCGMVCGVGEVCTSGVCL